MSEILRFPCTITHVRENIVQVHESGFGPDAKFHNESRDSVRLTLERV